MAAGENKLEVCSMDLALHVLRFTERCKGHYALINQLERSATSIGANIREAKYAHGRADFIAKLQIALKECYETEYWLELLRRAELFDQDHSQALLRECGSLRRMLVASVTTAKNHSK